MGMKINIILDDYIPCLDQEPIFARNNGNELWAILIEKAFAKLNGTYESIIGGLPIESFRVLTGAPTS